MRSSWFGSTNDVYYDCDALSDLDRLIRDKLSTFDRNGWIDMPITMQYNVLRHVYSYDGPSPTITTTMGMTAVSYRPVNAGSCFDELCVRFFSIRGSFVAHTIVCRTGMLKSPGAQPNTAASEPSPYRRSTPNGSPT